MKIKVDTMLGNEGILKILGFTFYLDFFLNFPKCGLSRISSSIGESADDFFWFYANLKKISAFCLVAFIIIVGKIQNLSFWSWETSKKMTRLIYHMFFGIRNQFLLKYIQKIIKYDIQISNLKENYNKYCFNKIKMSHFEKK